MGCSTSVFVEDEFIWITERLSVILIELIFADDIEKGEIEVDFVVESPNLLLI